jgi:hypothetical protein
MILAKNLIIKHSMTNTIARPDDQQRQSKALHATPYKNQVQGKVASCSRFVGIHCDPNVFRPT